MLGPDVVIGPDVSIGEGARVKRSSLFKGVSIGKSCYVNSSIIGWASKIKDWVRPAPLTSACPALPRHLLLFAVRPSDSVMH